MPRITADEAELLSPYLSEFTEVILLAWTDWLTSSIAAHMQHKRVRANNVWNQMVTHAKRLFEGRTGIQVVKVRNTWDGLLIGERIFVRMKKGNEQLLSSNVRTALSQAFNDPEEDLYNGVVMLDLVYVLDKVEAEVERVALVQRDHDRIVWTLDLLNDDENKQNVLPFAPPQPVQEERSVADRVLQPRREEHENEGTQQQQDRRVSS
ncbi:hypothetical protein PQU96_10765 [Vogesella sp. LYT5W]|uniref:Uncharacterized protein n=1 Tax=Vogesella margarita TaxID=2984199 RepID=A0ABT5IPV9_9NEIS|nr:hypothetical protein [Vogesella margarita]MDC7714600.1 hypothetical protein [Vogesella margarita]